MIRKTVLTFILIVFCAPTLYGATRADEYADKGEAYYGLRRFVDALSVLKKAVKEDPEHDRALYYLGLIYRDTDNYERAGYYFTKALKSNSNNGQAREELVKLHHTFAAQYSSDGNVNDAIKELNQIFSLGVYYIDTAVMLMNLYDAKRDYQSMINLAKRFEHNSSKVTGDVDLWGKFYYYGGMAAYKLKDYSYAEHLFDRSLKSQFEHSGAQAAYDQVRLILKKRVLPVLKKADAYARKGDYRKALETYKDALEIDSENSTIKDRIHRVENLLEAKNLLSEAKQMENDGQWVRAYELLEKASLKSPGDPDILGRIARIEKVLIKLQEKQAKERAELEKAQAARQSRIKELRDKADFAVSRKNNREAVHLYKELLKFVPDDTSIPVKIKQLSEAARIDELLKKALTSFEKKEYKEALQHFLVLQKEAPFHKAPPEYIARCYIALDDPVKAEHALKNLIDANKEDKNALLLLADLYYEGIEANSANIRRSLNLYYRLKSIDPENKIAASRISSLSWKLHKSKYIFIVFLILISVLTWVYLKMRPAILRKSLLRSLEKYAADEKWDSIRSMYRNVGRMSFPPIQEAQARYLFARAFYEKGFYKKAVKECQELTRLKRLSKKGRLLLARTYYRMKTISPEVLDLYIELLSEERTDKDLRNFVAEFCAAKKMINPTTLPLLRQFAVDSPDNDDLRNVLVKACLKSNDRGSAAMGLFRLEAERNSDNVEVRAILAEESLKAGKVEEAIAACEEIINIHLNHRKTHEVLLKAYEELGKLSDLASTYQTILEHDPHNAVINYYLKRILHPEGVDDGLPGSGTGSPDWTNQMSAGFMAEMDKAQPPVLDDGGGTPQVATSGMPCKKCGKPVPVGSYFCECGQPL